MFDSTIVRNVMHRLANLGAQRRWDTKFFLLLPLALALPYFLYGWGWMIAIGAGYQGAIRPIENSLAWDWAIFYVAARAWYEGALHQVYDQTWLKAVYDSSSWQGLHMWIEYPGLNYPPIYILLLIPFGLFSFGFSYFLFQVASFAGLVAVLRQALGRGRKFGFYLLSMFTCPASSLNVIAGQNAFVVGLIYVAGFGLLESRPLWAGAIIGLASFKPQLALMVPFALLGAGNWRTMIGAACSVLLLALISLIVLGPEIWSQWFGLVFHVRQDIQYTSIEWGRLGDDSIFTIAQMLGAPTSLANVLQLLAIAVAAACVYFAFRRKGPGDIRFAVFLTATVVAAPHVSGYDMILLAYAATTLVWNILREDIRPMAFIIPWLAWLLPMLCPPANIVTGYVAPLVMFALLGILVVRVFKYSAASD